MKSQKLDDWARQYHAALHTVLQQTDNNTPTSAAHDLGQLAVALGIDALAMAQMHDAALASILSSELTPEFRLSQIKKAIEFFEETLGPLNQTHSTSEETHTNLQKLGIALEQRTAELAESSHALREGISERKAATAELNSKSLESDQLLTASRALEDQLKNSARNILSASEKERRNMSLRLNDEVTQTLLGINLRMLALKSTVAANQVNLDKEIAIIQNLVDNSVKLINQIAHEFSV